MIRHGLPASEVTGSCLLKGILRNQEGTFKISMLRITRLIKERLENHNHSQYDRSSLWSGLTLTCEHELVELQV